MNTIFSDNPLLSIGAVISLFTIIAAHQLILYRRKIRTIEEKRLQFRSAITQEIADMRTRKHIFKDSSHINSLHKAMLDYRPFLSKEMQPSLDTAWAEYQDHEEYRAHTTQTESPMPQPAPWPKTEAVKYLNNLLKFSE